MNSGEHHAGKPATPPGVVNAIPRNNITTKINGNTNVYVNSLSSSHKCMKKAAIPKNFTIPTLTKAKTVAP